MLQVTLSVLFLAAFIFTLANIITIDSSQIRNLNKIFWIIIVIIIPVAGMILWWLVGREYSRGSDAVPFGDPRRYEATRIPRSGGSAGYGGANDAAFGVRGGDLDDAEIEAAVEREIAFHENEARIRRLEAEVQARKKGITG